VIRRESDITRTSFPFELLHATGPANNMRVFHWHDFMEISFVRSGRGVYEIEDKTFSVGPGDIIIINNTERHRVTYSPSAVLHETVLHFQPELFAGSGGPGSTEEQPLQLFRYEGAAFANKPALSPATRRAIRRLISEIRDEWTERRAWFEVLIRAKLLEILSLLLRERGRHRPLKPARAAARRKSIARLEQIIAWLRANYQTPVSLPTIARQFSMRPSYFSDYFRRNLGVTFTDYLAHLRIHEAAHLIDDGRMSSREAASTCGFNTTASFYRAFKKVMGRNPGEWLRLRSSSKGT
jgi:AraC-like DNA-binding protein